MGRIALASWLLTLALAYFAVGGYLGRLVEGLDRTAMSTAPLLVTGAALLASLVTTAIWSARRRGSQGRAPPSGRRRFLLGALGAGGGVAATGLAAIARNASWYTVTGKNIFLVRPPYKADVARDEWSGSRVVEYRRLGRTEARVSDISLGSGAGTGGRQRPEVAREAIERGINYFDTAPDYSEAGSEERLGRAIQGVRDQMFLATKFCTPYGHVLPGSAVEAYMEAVNGSLKRLRTDRVDLVHVHSCDSVERLMDENVHEAFDRLKEQGKVRFLGVSTHTPNLPVVANAAIDSGRFDVLMLAYHFGALVTAVVLFKVLIPGDYSRTVFLLFLPVFGFLTLGMHAGYAVYFPELYPTRLRGTGAGFGFNAGRIGSAGALLAAGLLAWSPNQSALTLAPLYGLGIIVALLGKETLDEGISRERLVMLQGQCLLLTGKKDEARKLFVERIDLLKADGSFDESIVVLTADHGEELFDHGGFGHGHTLHREVLHVPLYVKLPGQQTGRTIDSAVSRAAASAASRSGSTRVTRPSEAASPASKSRPV